MGCASSSAARQQPGQSRDDYEQLAAGTVFTVDEVYALAELFDDLSNRLHQDGLIHKDEFVYALFKVQSAGNLFTDRVFKMFDTKENDVIDFGEFVHALSVFHPKAALKDKAACALPYQQNVAFRMYDLDNTGSIEKHEVARLLAALSADNPGIHLSEPDIESLVEQTFIEADLAGDGRISPEEWFALVDSNPEVISYMTVGVLRELTVKYSSFIFNRDGR